jgi:hypothetical protein
MGCLLGNKNGFFGITRNGRHGERSAANAALAVDARMQYSRPAMNKSSTFSYAKCCN